MFLIVISVIFKYFIHQIFYILLLNKSMFTRSSDSKIQILGAHILFQNVHITLRSTKIYLRNT